MAKTLFIGLLFSHGLVHIFGFAKAFGFLQLAQLNLAIPRLQGVTWLLTGTLFFIVGALRLSDIDWWWILAFIAVLLSQILIIAYWQDAKMGTLPNIIILIVTFVGVGEWNFTQMTNDDLSRLTAFGKTTTSEVFTEEDLSEFPPIVHKWLQRSGIVGMESAHIVHLEQSGRMCISQNGKWMPFRAEQWFSTQTPGFVWIVEVEIAPGIYLAGRDKYLEGKGNMRIQPLSLFPLVNADGTKIDQSSLLRYLAEIVWIPAAAKTPYITWEQLKSRSARATITHAGISISGIFTFDENGNVLRFEAKRYKEDTLEDWLIEIDPDSYQEFGQLRLPTSFQVTWKLADGDWTWLELKVESIEQYAPKEVVPENLFKSKL